MADQLEETYEKFCAIARDGCTSVKSWRNGFLEKKQSS